MIATIPSDFLFGMVTGILIVLLIGAFVFGRFVAPFVKEAAKRAKP